MFFYLHRNPIVHSGSSYLDRESQSFSLPLPVQTQSICPYLEAQETTEPFAVGEA